MSNIFPTSSTLQAVSPVLQNLVVSYANSQADYIAARVLPTVPTEGEESGTIHTVGRASTFGDVSAQLLRGYKSGYHRILGPQLSTLTFLCEEFGDETVLDMRQVQTALESRGSAIDLEALSSQIAIDNLLIAQERRAAALLFNTSTFSTTSLSGTSQWSASTGDPTANINARVKAVQGAIGKRPNTVILGRDPYYTLLENPALIARAPDNTARQVLEDADLRAYFRKFGLTNFFAGLTIYNSANQGQTFTGAAIWGDYVWIGYMDYDTPAVAVGRNVFQGSSSAAARFVHTELSSEEYDDNPIRSHVIRHRQVLDEVVLSAASANIIADTVA